MGLTNTRPKILLILACDRPEPARPTTIRSLVVVNTLTRRTNQIVSVHIKKQKKNKTLFHPPKITPVYQGRNRKTASLSLSLSLSSSSNKIFSDRKRHIPPSPPRPRGLPPSLGFRALFPLSLPLGRRPGSSRRRRRRLAF